MTTPQNPQNPPYGGAPQGEPAYPGSAPGSDPGAYSGAPDNLAYGNQGYYGQENQGYYGQPPAKSGKAFGIVALVLGILALLTSWIPFLGIFTALVFAIPAFVLGILSVRRAKPAGEGRGMGIAGIILGVVSAIVAVVVTVLVVGVFQSTDLGQCLIDAGGDQTKIQQCQNDFENQVNNP